MKRLTLRDDAGNKVGAGDKVSFNYGIPPVYVVGSVVKKNGRLVVLTPGHTPPECKLRSLRSYVGGWLKCDAKGQA